VEFSTFVLSEMEDGLQIDAVYTDLLKAFDRVNHELLLGTMTRKIRGSMILWMGSYLTGRTQRVRVGDYLSEAIYCHSDVTQGKHLGLLFFIADINDVLDIFENVRVLTYADDLKLYMRVSSTDDFRFFQQDLDRLQGWCREKKNDLNAGKCKSISFSRGSKSVMFQFVIGDSDLERVDAINDLGVLVHRRMTFVNHIESIVLKSARMLGFIK
jgi:hypothetical protein